MPRLSPIDPAKAPAITRELLVAVESKLGMVPNVIATLAHSPAAAQGYLSFSDAVSGGVLSEGLREQVAVAVAQANGSVYCVAAHCAIGSSVGLTDDELRDARTGNATDRKAAAALRFARRIVDVRGSVSDDDVASVRDAGYGDAEIVEIVANVALNTFTNYFNHVAGTEVDFPRVAKL